MKSTNLDLLPTNPDRKYDSPSMHRAFTQAQLIIYRERDTSSILTSSKIFDQLAEEIEELSRAWDKYNKDSSP
jgi:hypothetical protein